MTRLWAASNAYLRLQVDSIDIFPETDGKLRAFVTTTEFITPRFTPDEVFCRRKSVLPMCKLNIFTTLELARDDAGLYYITKQDDFFLQSPLIMLAICLLWAWIGKWIFGPFYPKDDAQMVKRQYDAIKGAATSLGVKLGKRLR